MAGDLTFTRVKDWSSEQRFTIRDDVKYYFDYLMWKSGFDTDERDKVGKELSSLEDTETIRLWEMDTDEERIEAIKDILNN